MARLLRRDEPEFLSVEQIRFAKASKALVVKPDAFFTENTRTYLRDTHDHCAQAMDLVDAYREVTNRLFNTYLSAVGNRTNEIMASSPSWPASSSPSRSWPASMG